MRGNPEEFLGHWLFFTYPEYTVEVNLCQKHLFLHQLTHNITTDCFLNCEFSTRKLQVQYMLCTQIGFFCFCFHIQNNLSTQLVVFMYWTRNLMNNLLSYCGLVDARISASENFLPLLKKVFSFDTWFFPVSQFWSKWGPSD